MIVYTMRVTLITIHSQHRNIKTKPCQICYNLQKANGGILDRFLGQNLSGIEKVQQKVKSYIDSNLGAADFRNELVEFLKQRERKGQL